MGFCSSRNLSHFEHSLLILKIKEKIQLKAKERHCLNVIIITFYKCNSIDHIIWIIVCFIYSSQWNVIISDSNFNIIRLIRFKENVKLLIN